MNRTLAQNLALGFGVVFLVVGILGFIPGITTNYDDLEFAGTDSAAELLGIFQVTAYFVTGRERPAATVTP